jgi:ABC-type sugar transport system ATPase subunit
VILRIADEVTVLRDGHRIASSPIEDLDEKQLIALMVGRDLEPRSSDLGPGIGDVVLEVVGLRRHGTTERVSFVARRGEVLGFAGLMGAGRTELASTIFGLLPREEGEVRVNGALVHVGNPSDAMRAGIMMLPEDRKRSGIVPGHSILENMTLASLQRFCRGPWIDRHAERDAVRANMRSLEVKARRPDDQIETLSGGNQQKVLIARALLVEPEILILDEPTRGIDIGAKAEIHGLIRRFARSGKAVIMLSSELPEILSLSDRVLVMRGGAISAELDPHRTTEHEILTFAMPANAAGQPDHAS